MNREQVRTLKPGDRMRVVDFDGKTVEGRVNCVFEDRVRIIWDDHYHTTLFYDENRGSRCENIEKISEATVPGMGMSPEVALLEQMTTVAFYGPPLPNEEFVIFMRAYGLVAEEAKRLHFDEFKNFVENLENYYPDKKDIIREVFQSY